MNPYNLNPGPESLRWLGIAEKLLNSRDFVGSKTFATRARESDPNLEEAGQILAIVDTLIAGEKQISNNHLDWYAILQLARRTHDSELIASQYRRLGVLLNPNRNKFAFAEHAFKLVAEAWLVLSNPSRKFQFDNEFGNSNSTHFNFIQQHYETPPPPQVQQQNNIGCSTHFNFMQEPSEQLHQSSQMQQQFSQPFVQQQRFPPQPLQFFSEQQHHTQPLPQQLHWSNQSQQPLLRPQPQQPLLRPQPQQTWLQQPQPQPHIQQPLHWSQPVSQHPLQPQPLLQQPLSSSEIQQPSPKPQSQPLSQPEKPPPVSRERVENNTQFNLGENGGNHENIANVVEPSNFWTVCAYCYHMYEYPGIYAECSLRCQNCKKAFHAVRVNSPPVVAEGEDAYFRCWGFFPIGVSTSYLEKRKAGASSWTPFSTMYAFPQEGNTGKPKNGRNAGPTMYAFPQGGNTGKPKNVRNTGPWTYIDDDNVDIFDGIYSSEDSDEDWGSAPKKKKARSLTRKVSTAKKVKQPQVYRAEKVQGSNMGNLHSGIVAQEGSSVSVPNASVPSVSNATVPNVPNAAVPSVPDAAVPSVPVAEANEKAVGEADKKAAGAIGETSQKKVAVPTRKQPGRGAKELGKLDLNVEFNNEVEGPARRTSGGNKAGTGTEENIEGVAFFEGLDEFLSSLPILSVDAGDKAKAV